MTVMNFLQHVRMHHALYLLAEDKYKIGETAKQVGYYDAGYFCKVFKKATGVLPTQYRKKHMKK